jgi:hypothetical protein
MESVECCSCDKEIKLKMNFCGLFFQGPLIPASSWQILYVGCSKIIEDFVYRDCKDGKDGMRVVEATSTSIVIYDVFDRTVRGIPSFEDE